jgi:hypothetical protein
LHRDSGLHGVGAIQTRPLSGCKGNVAHANVEVALAGSASPGRGSSIRQLDLDAWVDCLELPGCSLDQGLERR